VYVLDYTAGIHVHLDRAKNVKKMGAVTTSGMPTVVAPTLPSYAKLPAALSASPTYGWVCPLP
jgi:hypothetical protein